MRNYLYDEWRSNVSLDPQEDSIDSHPYIFIERLNKITQLEKLFRTDIIEDIDLSIFDIIALHPNNHCSDEVKRVVTSVEHFFDEVGIVFKKTNVSYLRRHLFWIINKIDVRFVQYTHLKSCIIQYFVMIFGANLCRNQDLNHDISKKAPPFYFKPYSRERERIAQIKLLTKLSFALGLNREQQVENLRCFLFWQGKTILSKEEGLLWRDILNDNYEELPQIGFQLICMDYYQACLPEFYQFLTYVGGSRLHIYGFADYLNSHTDIIKKYANDKHLPDSLDDAYYRSWSDPTTQHIDKLMWLTDSCPIWKIPKDNFGAEIKSLRHLVFEAAIQEKYRMRAKRILAHQIEKQYGFSVEALI